MKCHGNETQTNIPSFFMGIIYYSNNNHNKKHLQIHTARIKCMRTACTLRNIFIRHVDF